MQSRLCSRQCRWGLVGLLKAPKTHPSSLADGSLDAHLRRCASVTPAPPNVQFYGEVDRNPEDTIVFGLKIKVGWELALWILAACKKGRVKSHQNCGNLLVYLPGGLFPISSAWQCYNFGDVIHICERADFPSSSPEAILSGRGILMSSSQAGFLPINVPPLIRSPRGRQLWSHN